MCPQVVFLPRANVCQQALGRHPPRAFLRPSSRLSRRVPSLRSRPGSQEPGPPSFLHQARAFRPAPSPPPPHTVSQETRRQDLSLHTSSPQFVRRGTSWTVSKSPQSPVSYKAALNHSVLSPQLPGQILIRLSWEPPFSQLHSAAHAATRWWLIPTLPSLASFTFRPWMYETTKTNCPECDGGEAICCLFWLLQDNDPEPPPLMCG